MRILRTIFDFYIQSSIHVAFAVLALAHSTQLQAHSIHIPHFLPAVFWGTLVGYNFLKYAALFYDNKAKTIWYQAIAVCTFVAVCCVALEFYQLSTAHQLLFFCAGACVLMYPILRRHGWLKLFFVSAVVTYITVFIPLWATSHLSELFLLLFQRFLLLSCLLIPFEISDSAIDPLLLHTLPQRLGIFKTKLMGYGLLFLFLLLTFWQTNNKSATIVVACLTALSIFYSSPKRSHYYTSFWIESVPIVWWVVLLFC